MFRLYTIYHLSTFVLYVLLHSTFPAKDLPFLLLYKGICCVLHTKVNHSTELPIKIASHKCTSFLISKCLFKCQFNLLNREILTQFLLMYVVLLIFSVQKRYPKFRHFIFILLYSSLCFYFWKCQFISVWIADSLPNVQNIQLQVCINVRISLTL